MMTRMRMMTGALSIGVALCGAVTAAHGQSYPDTSSLPRTKAWLENDAAALLSSRILNPSSPQAFSARHISGITLSNCMLQWTSTDTIVTAAGKQYDSETRYRLPMGKVNVSGIVVSELAPSPTRNVADLLVRLPARTSEGKIVERWVGAVAQPIIDLASLPVRARTDGMAVASALVRVATACGAPDR